MQGWSEGLARVRHKPVVKCSGDYLSGSSGLRDPGVEESCEDSLVKVFAGVRSGTLRAVRAVRQAVSGAHGAGAGVRRGWRRACRGVGERGARGGEWSAARSERDWRRGGGARGLHVPRPQPAARLPRRAPHARRRLRATPPRPRPPPDIVNIELPAPGSYTIHACNGLYQCHYCRSRSLCHLTSHISRNKQSVQFQ